MNWLLIILAVVVIVIISQLIHFKAFKHKLLVVVLVVLVFFLIVTFVSIANNSSINLKTASGLFQAGKIYFSWLGHIFGNLKVLTGNVVRMDWFSNMTAKLS